MRIERPHRSKRNRAGVSFKTAVMVAVIGLVTTFCIPANASPMMSQSGNLRPSSVVGIQNLTGTGALVQSPARDGVTVTADASSLDSTTRTIVSPIVQALAAKLMADVATGKLFGSTPDHIGEIRNLANGMAVPGCGVDYRVLQTIDVALQNFDRVGVSDINRFCTGQLEGAGSASSHYADGGGHAVDFFNLNGHPLTGGDPDSVKLLRILDPLVPAKTNAGQIGCRAPISLQNFEQFSDSCNHLHIDFGQARGASLTY